MKKSCRLLIILCFAPFIFQACRTPATPAEAKQSCDRVPALEQTYLHCVRNAADRYFDFVDKLSPSQIKGLALGECRMQLQEYRYGYGTCRMHTSDQPGQVSPPVWERVRMDDEHVATLQQKASTDLDQKIMNRMKR